MKIRISFKTPDTVHYAVTNHIESLDPPDPKDADFEYYEDDPEGWFSQQADDLKEFLGQWVSRGENISITFDTETKTATVDESPDR